MIREIIMPKLGETMEDGVISKWLRKEGDKVTKGEPLFEVSTDKANFEVECPASGVLRKILFPAGGPAVQVIKVVGYIADSMDEQLPSFQGDRETPGVEAAKEPAKTAVKSPAPAVERDSGVIAASPAAKKLAREKGIDLGKIKGTGPGGRIVEKDVLDAGTQDTTSGLTGMRKVIAQRMVRSKQEVPHFYLEIEIDMTEAGRKKTEGVTYNDIIIKGVAQALEMVPEANAHFTSGIVSMKDVNISVAVNIADGLVVPVIRNANKKKLGEISAEMKAIKEKAKSGKFVPGDYEGGTFTVSNLGGYGIDAFMAIINQPQVGILAVGKIKDTAVILDGKVAARKTMRVCGSFDHRGIDGAKAAEFMKALKDALESAL